MCTSFSGVCPASLKTCVLSFLEWYSDFMDNDISTRVVLESVADMRRLRYVSCSKPAKSGGKVVGWKVVVRFEPMELSQAVSDQASGWIADILLDLIKNLLYVRAEHYDIPYTPRQLDYPAWVVLSSYVHDSKNALPVSIASQKRYCRIDKIERIRVLLDLNNHRQAILSLSSFRRKDRTWKLLMAEALRQKGAAWDAVAYCRAALYAGCDDLHVNWELAHCLYSAQEFKMAYSYISDCLARLNEICGDCKSYGREDEEIVNDLYFLKACCCLRLKLLSKGRESLIHFSYERARRKLSSCFGRCEIRRVRRALFGCHEITKSGLGARGN